MIYGIKLLLPILLIWVLSLGLMPVIFKGMLDSLEIKATLWVVLLFTLVEFLSFRVEIFFVVAIFALLIGQQILGGGVKAKIAAFWMAVILFPPFKLDVAGFGGINQLISIDHFRIAAIVLLIPAAFRIVSEQTPRKPTRLMDAAVLCYPIFSIVLSYPHVATTAALRSAVELLLDIALPYFVMTRGLRDWDELRFVLRRVLLVGIFAACAALLEAIIRKNIYAELQWVYGFTWSLTHTLMRGNWLRVQAMTSEPIVLAAQMLFMVGLWYSVRPRGEDRVRTATVSLFLIAVLVLTWSRGPLLGVAIFAAALFTINRTAVRVFSCLLLLAIAAAVAAKAAGLDEPVLALLKSAFGGNAEDMGSIDYRSKLLDASLALIKQSPWFGVPNYTAYMQDLVQGEGIIDLVNTYVAVALDTGLVGLSLYLLPFVLVIAKLLRQLSSARAAADAQGIAFASAFIALLVALLVTIFTTSTYERIPYLLLLTIAAPTLTFSFVDKAQQRTPAPL